MDKQQLIDFEDWVIKTYKDGKLRSPVHLSRGNEDQLIEIFKGIKKQDWVFSTYRSHYHALLKGIDPEWLKAWILSNKSIHVQNAEHNFYTSAIVGGTLPVALGAALAIKLKDKCPECKEWWFVNDGEKVCHNCGYEKNHVYCFIGDMT